jgi:hypothetical protein
MKASNSEHIHDSKQNNHAERRPNHEQMRNGGQLSKVGMIGII